MIIPVEFAYVHPNVTAVELATTVGEPGVTSVVKLFVTDPATFESLNVYSVDPAAPVKVYTGAAEIPRVRVGVDVTDAVMSCPLPVTTMLVPDPTTDTKDGGDRVTTVAGEDTRDTFPP